MESIFNVEAVASAVCGKAVNCNMTDMISSVSTDTRTIEEGAVFFALKGETDGHRFIKSAVEKGAVCCVADNGADVPDDLPIIFVEDTSKALLDLAGAYRKRMRIPIVAVTGSVGKTSTRSMIGCVLSQKYKTLVTEGNFNNEIGVPHTLFKLSEEHQMAVVEMGMSNFGELSRITAAVRPDVVVITNIGEAHMENLGSREGILKAKLEALEGLSDGGSVILNGDDDMLWGVNGTLNYETLYYGTDNKNNDILAEGIKTYADNSEFSFSYEDKVYSARINVPGKHHVYNALAAILTGVKYNVPMNSIIEGIREFMPVGMRQAAVKVGKLTLIKDCYNASPTSMKSGLEILKLNDGDGRKVACLGDMLELGTISEREHYQTGKYVAEYGVDCLITVGERSNLIAAGARDAGMSDDCIFSFDDNKSLCSALSDIIKEDDVILLKASRSMHLEEVSEYIEHTFG